MQGVHLVLAFVGSGATQPDLVLAEVAGDVGHHFAHGDALAAAIVPSKPRCLAGLQQQPQLLSQLSSKTCRFVTV